MTTAAPLTRILIGRVADFGPPGDSVQSAIVKAPVGGRIRVGIDGLAGDEQADRAHHGGPDKAVHHYPLEHYDAWLDALPSSAALLRSPGAFGENLSSLGMTEANTCLGDVYLLGGAVLQVSQGRQPCRKLNLRFGRDDMQTRVLESGRTGWYYRVLHAGDISVGDRFERMERPCPDWPLTRLWQVLFGAAADPAALTQLAEMEVLSQSWRDRARKRLQHGNDAVVANKFAPTLP